MPSANPLIINTGPLLALLAACGSLDPLRLSDSLLKRVIEMAGE